MNNNPPNRYLQSGKKRYFGPITRAIMDLRNRELVLQAEVESPQVAPSDANEPRPETADKPNQKASKAELDAHAKASSIQKVRSKT